MRSLVVALVLVAGCKGRDVAPAAQQEQPSPAQAAAAPAPSMAPAPPPPPPPPQPKLHAGSVAATRFSGDKLVECFEAEVRFTSTEDPLLAPERGALLLIEQGLRHFSGGPKTKSALPDSNNYLSVVFVTLFSKAARARIMEKAAAVDAGPDANTAAATRWIEGMEKDANWPLPVYEDVIKAGKVVRSSGCRFPGKQARSVCTITGGMQGKGDSAGLGIGWSLRRLGFLSGGDEDADLKRCLSAGGTMDADKPAPAPQEPRRKSLLLQMMEKRMQGQ